MDINVPLTVGRLILLSSEITCRHKSKTFTQIELIDNIHNELDKMARLAESVRALARLLMLEVVCFDL